MQRFIDTCLAFLATPQRALLTLMLLGAIGLGSVPLCAAQAPADGAQPPDDERPRERVEERNEYLASRGFYRRQAAGHGWFLTRSDPEVKRSRTVSDVLRTVPGVNARGTTGRVLVASHRQPGACPLAVFVDGLYTTIRNVDELTLEDIAGLEVYRGPSEVPLAYTAPSYDRTCGALLVWSRMQLSDD
jgi:hypothetical protein